MIESLTSILKGHLKDKKKVFAAVSGGADSVFLFFFLKEIKKTFGFELNVLHVNYNLRGADSIEARGLVKALCKEWGARFLLKEVNEKPKGNLEDWARKIRYGFFAETLEKNGEEEIIVAHNLDDLVETFFLKIVKGRALKSVLGMKEKDILTINGKKITVLRPLLHMEKKNILEFIEENGLPFCEDITNRDIRYSRNFIRHRIIGEMDSRFGKWKKHFRDFYLSASETEAVSARRPDFEEDMRIVRTAIPERMNDGVFESIKAMLFRIGYPEDLVKRAYMEHLRKFLFSKGGKYLKLSRNYYIFKGYEHIYAYEESSLMRSGPYAELGPGCSAEIKIPFLRFRIKNAGRNTVTVRCFRYGDRVTYKGEKRMLSKDMKKAKIDNFIRRLYPVAETGGKIIMLPGIKTYDEKLAACLEVK